MLKTLLAQYHAAHFRSLDDSARQHLGQFADFIQARLNDARDLADGVDMRLALSADFLIAHGYGVVPPTAPAEPEQAPAEHPVIEPQGADSIARFERRTYANGTTATGLAPLPAYLDKEDGYPDGVPTVAVEPVFEAPEGFADPTPAEPASTTPTGGDTNASGGGAGEEDPPPK